MKMLGKKFIGCLLVLAMLFSMAAPASAAASDAANYGKLLDSYTANGSTFTLSQNSRFFVVSAAEPTGQLLQTIQLVNREFAAKGYPANKALEIVWGDEEQAEAGDIVIKKDASLAVEAYALNVREKAVVTYADVDGLLYGMNSLLKFFIADGDKTLAGFTAADAPDTKERTVMLDTGRKYYTVEWICNFIRQMSWMGYNSIQVHVSEDGGFRADFWDPVYYTDNYSPENDFSWLCGSHVQSWVKDPYRTDPDAGKYLTTAELVQICEVAKEYHIDIIPSFDSPAHMDYITWKFEQNYKNNKNYYFSYGGLDYFASSTNGCINYTGKTGDSSPTWPYYTTIDITDGTMAKAFVFALYEDIADFFKEYAGSTDFAIGADEVNLSSGYGVKWNYSQFPEYVNELNRMLNDKGYTCRMFNDFIGSTTYNQKNSKAVYNFDNNIEIMYWNSDFNPTTGKWNDPIWHVKFFWENNTGSTDNWGDGGRTMYNCIQTNCYYVLRIGTDMSKTSDARNPQNRNWTFYDSTEESIYNEWYPADISEKGVYNENAADVPADQLGGGYFLIWNDYASLNTEAEVWNDVKDSMGAGYTYSLFDRMYSNIIKMWNSDIDDCVDYTAFVAARDKIKTNYFPGFNGCSADAELPAAGAVSPAKADTSALEAVLKVKVSNDEALYTDSSYAAYVSAYEAGEKLVASPKATKAEIEQAIKNLANAKAALKVNSLTINYILEEDNSKLKDTTIHTPDAAGNYSVELEAMEGYQIVSVDGGNYIADAQGIAGTISGTIKNGATIVTVQYKKLPPSVAALEEALKNVITEQGKYTEDSWAKYVEARDIALDVLENLPEDFTQEDVDAVLKAYVIAKENLAVVGAETSIASIKLVATTARLTKPIGLKITTTADVHTVSVDGKAVTSYTCTNVKLDDGSAGKLWVVNFKASKKGTQTFAVTVKGDGAATKTIKITVK